MIDWKFKEKAEPQGTSDFWYDLVLGGYIKPEEMLSDPEQVKEIEKAVNVLSSFERAAKDAELIVDC